MHNAASDLENKMCIWFSHSTWRGTRMIIPSLRKGSALLTDVSSKIKILWNIILSIPLEGDALWMVYFQAWVGVNAGYHIYLHDSLFQRSLHTSLKLINFLSNIQDPETTIVTCIVVSGPWYKTFYRCLYIFVVYGFHNSDVWDTLLKFWSLSSYTYCIFIP